MPPSLYASLLEPAGPCPVHPALACSCPGQPPPPPPDTTNPLCVPAGSGTGAVTFLGMPVPSSSPALQQLVRALRVLPRVTAHGLEPGGWCINAPLWGNPLLLAVSWAEGLGGYFPNLGAVCAMVAVGDAVLAFQAIDFAERQAGPLAPGAHL